MLQQPFYIEKRTLPQNHFDLNGIWSFCSEDTKTDDIASLQFKNNATIPAGTYMNIYEAGLLPHPYVGTNSSLYRSVDQKIWYYKREFSLHGYKSQGQAFLCFDGMGYYSRVWLNGTLLGEHEGLFGGPIVEVDGLLNYGGDNTLIVEIMSCSYGFTDEEWKNMYRNPQKKFLVPWNMIKDTHTSNGDFTAMGIYRDVRLELVSPLHISRPFLATINIGENYADLRLSLEIIPPELDELKVPMGDAIGNGYVYGYVRGMNIVDTDTTVDIRYELVDKATGNVAFSKTESQNIFDYNRVGINTKYNEGQFFERDIRIENPRLWYPLGLGEPNLYTVNITLICNGEELDFHTFDFGIRTFELTKTAGRRMRTRWGNYQAVINGKKFFMKGMNWTLLDFTLTVSKNDYRWALELIKNQNVHLIRVWGAGNAPEHDDFYNLCDQMGIMVWQDSFISNHSNPNWDKELFTAQQSMYLYRIRNHPSLVVHCSGNENNPYAVENHCVWVWHSCTEDLDPYRPMVRTTPDGGGAHVYNVFEPCWFRKMYKELPFIGEAGTQCFPNAKTFRQLLGDEFYTPIKNFGDEEMARTHPALVNHMSEYGDPLGIRAKMPLISHICRFNDISISDICMGTSIAAYEYYQFMAQAMREQYPVTGGLMPWVFKRPWATVAVQMIDGNYDPIAPYYAIKNSYLPLSVHLALTELTYAKGEKIKLDVRILNETEKSHNLCCDLQVYSPKLKLCLSKKSDILISGDEYQNSLDFGEFTIPDEFNESYFVIRVAICENGKLVSQSVYWPVVRSVMEDEEFRVSRREKYCLAMAHENGPFLIDQISTVDKATLKLSATDVSRNGDRVEGKFTVENTSDNPAFAVHIVVENNSMVQCLEDDYFFIEAGGMREINFVLRNDTQSLEEIIASVSALNSSEVKIKI
ncbi:MAG: glycoside hydrolase family 2 TIM barrel-domain containing protein [Acutalibacteraceae bacterium]|nr:glycoside hydrolase family 2 TIM barrel-domain containing protein [Acutalibacteraceae bacterium]